MLHLDIIRGKHSTGVASVDAKGDWTLAKKKGTAWDLFDSREYEQLMLNTSYCLIGHNRAATKGKVNNINAHPFEFEDVVGAHNGTLRGQHRLIDYKDFEVDSENIFHSVQQLGLMDTLNSLEGAYALSLWDKRDEGLVLVRNSERTLYYALTEDKKCVLWASEEWMIEVACKRTGIKHGEVKPLDIHTVYRFTFDRTFNPKTDVQVSEQKFEAPVFPKPAVPAGKPGFGGKVSGALPAPKKEATKLKVDPWSLIGKVVEFIVESKKTSALGVPFYDCELLCCPDVPLHLYASPILDKVLADTGYDTTYKGKAVTYRSGILTLNPNTVEELIEEEDDSDDDLFTTFEGSEVTKDQWIRMTQKGCCICLDIPDSLEADELIWTSRDTFVCPACRDLDFVKEYIIESR